MTEVEGTLTTLRAVEREHAYLSLNLALIGKLQEGQKLCVEGTDLAIDTTIFQFASRWIYSQDKKRTKELVVQIMERGERCLRTLLSDYSALRETSYQGQNFDRTDTRPYELELLLRHRIYALYTHMQEAVQGLDRLARTYSSNAVFNQAFSHIASNTRSFLLRFASIWSYQHQLLKSNAETFSPVHSVGPEDLGSQPSTGMLDMPGGGLPSNSLLRPRVALGKPPPAFSLDSQSGQSFSSELYVPIAKGPGPRPPASSQTEGRTHS